MKALVIGGTGPTGPYVVCGLVERGYDVTVYHRGLHEVPDLPKVRHLHGDPFLLEDLERDLTGQRWDVVFSMYGRLRVIADVLAGKTDRFVGIGGQAGLVRAEELPFPDGYQAFLTEDHPTYRDRSPGHEFGFAVAETERRVMRHHEQGHFNAVLLRYASVYGPRVPRQWLWPIVRRILDGRHVILVPGFGDQIRPMCYVANAANCAISAGLSSDANGRVYHCADHKTYALRDVIRLVAETLGHDLEIVGISAPVVFDLAASYSEPRSRALSGERIARDLGIGDAVEPADGIRHTARWLVENVASLDIEHFNALVPNPYAYDTEDGLIASYRRWQREVAATVHVDAPVRFVGEFRR